MTGRHAHHVQYVMLADSDDNYAPPEKPCLQVAQIGDDVFLDIGKYDETHDTSTFRPTGRISVRREALMRALDLINHPLSR